MPLLHIIRSRLEVLAEYLNLPGEIRHKKSDPDILPGLNNKGRLIGSFQEARLILWGIENNVSLNEIEGTIGHEKVKYIHSLVSESVYYQETPFSLIQDGIQKQNEVNSVIQ